MISRLKAGSHSCFGAFDAAGEPAADLSMLERPAMLVYVGEFQSMDGPVEIKDKHLDLIMGQHNSILSKVKRLASGDVPAKACPPIQLDHSTSARDTVGRLVGDLTIAPYELSDGRQVNALFGKVRVLGKENVEKVVDGRWTHLSIGADLATGKVTELTITPFPAAAEASLLKRGEETNLSQGDPMDTEKMKKYLMDVKKMSEADADAKMSGWSDDEKTAMSAEAADHEAKMASDIAEQAEKDKVAASAALVAAPAAGVQLTADQKTKVVALFAGIKKQGDTARLEAKKSSLMVRLGGLKASAKITPAEVKKIDIAKLSNASDETVEAVFKSYEDREPVILTGVHGTAKATNAAQVAKDIQKQNLEAETAANMPGIKKAMLAAGKNLPRTAAKLAAASGASSAETQEPSPDVDAIVALMDGGKTDEAKIALKKFVANLSNAGYAGQTEVPQEMRLQMEALAESVKAMQNQVEEVMKLVEPILST